MKNLIYSRWWFCFCFQLPTWGNSEIWEHLVLVLFHQQVDLLPYWYVIHVNCDHAASLGKREFPTPNKSLGCWRGVWCLFCGSKWSTAIQNRWHSPYILVYKGPLLTYWYLLVFVPSILTFRYVFFEGLFVRHLFFCISPSGSHWWWKLLLELVGVLVPLSSVEIPSPAAYFDKVAPLRVVSREILNLHAPFAAFSLASKVLQHPRV